MSPRPRKASDEDLLAAVHRAMTRLGPGELTLAAVAEEAGITAGVLVQRFGSKRQMLLALAERSAAGQGNFMESLRNEHASPLGALRAYAECMAGLAASPAALARNLAYLQIDLTDEDFRRHLAAQAKAARDAFERLIDEAKVAGELVPQADSKALARVVETTLSGSLLTWAYDPRSAAARWLVEDLELVLTPWRVGGVVAPRGRKRKSRP